MKPASMRKGKVVAYIAYDEDGRAYIARTETFSSINAAKRANGPNGGDGKLPFQVRAFLVPKK